MPSTPDRRQGPFQTLRLGTTPPDLTTTLGPESFPPPTVNRRRKTFLLTPTRPRTLPLASCQPTPSTSPSTPNRPRVRASCQPHPVGTPTVHRGPGSRRDLPPGPLRTHPPVPVDRDLDRFGSGSPPGGDRSELFRWRGSGTHPERTSGAGRRSGGRPGSYCTPPAEGPVGVVGVRPPPGERGGTGDGEGDRPEGRLRTSPVPVQDPSRDPPPS